MDFTTSSISNAVGSRRVERIDKEDSDWETDRVWRFVFERTSLPRASTVDLIAFDSGNDYWVILSILPYDEKHDVVVEAIKEFWRRLFISEGIEY